MTTSSLSNRQTSDTESCEILQEPPIGQHFGGVAHFNLGGQQRMPVGDFRRPFDQQQHHHHRHHQQPGDLDEEDDDDCELVDGRDSMDVMHDGEEDDDDEEDADAAELSARQMMGRNGDRARTSATAVAPAGTDPSGADANLINDELKYGAGHRSLDSNPVESQSEWSDDECREEATGKNIIKGAVHTNNN